MRYYQLEGLNWLINLNHKGVNGIVADEMGLGKTLQTIALLGWLQQNGVSGPHLIVVPKSTLSSWMTEMQRWCPSLKAIQLHGDKDERAATIDTSVCERGATARG